MIALDRVVQPANATARLVAVGIGHVRVRHIRADLEADVLGGHGPLHVAHELRAGTAHFLRWVGRAKPAGRRALEPDLQGRVAPIAAHPGQHGDVGRAPFGHEASAIRLIGVHQAPGFTRAGLDEIIWRTTGRLDDRIGQQQVRSWFVCDRVPPVVVGGESRLIGHRVQRRRRHGGQQRQDFDITQAEGLGQCSTECRCCDHILATSVARTAWIQRVGQVGEVSADQSVDAHRNGLLHECAVVGHDCAVHDRAAVRRGIIVTHHTPAQVLPWQRRASCFDSIGHVHFDRIIRRDQAAVDICAGHRDRPHDHIRIVRAHDLDAVTVRRRIGAIRQPVEDDVAPRVCRHAQVNRCALGHRRTGFIPAPGLFLHKDFEASTP